MTSAETIVPRREALYYLRLGVGFFTLWSAWDVLVHQSQWNALFTFFPLTDAFSEVLMLAWFLVLLLAGTCLLTGYYFREAAVVMAVMLFLATFVFSFFLPKVNAVLGPFRPLVAKNLVWLGACLPLIVENTDPYNPERRAPQGLPALADRAHLLFRLLLGAYLLWDGVLKAANAHGYFVHTVDAVARLPFLPGTAAPHVVTVLYLIQLVAGVMVVTGIRFRWAAILVLALSAVNLLGINWFAGKELLRSGGRFMQRDLLVFVSGWYFLLTGPGRPTLVILVNPARPSGPPPAPMSGPPPDSGQPLR